MCRHRSGFEPRNSGLRAVDIAIELPRPPDKDASTVLKFHLE